MENSIIRFKSELSHTDRVIYIFVVDGNDPRPEYLAKTVPPGFASQAEQNSNRGERAGKSAKNVQTESPPSMYSDSLITLVEDAFKRLWDFNYLGNHPLTRLCAIQLICKSAHVPQTGLERAKAVTMLLTETLEKLRPDGPLPNRRVIPRREWHPYLILHCAYVDGDRNYEIMNWLQISEGTFNRTRRRALLAIANALAEMESQHLSKGE